MPSGRLTDYNEEVAAEICARLAGGESLRSVCRDDGMPDKATIFRWIAKHETFRDQYTKAKAESADAWAEQILDISDDGEEDVQRSRLRVDTRKWLMSRMLPKKYGDKVALEHGGSINLTHEQWLASLDGDGNPPKAP